MPDPATPDPAATEPEPVDERDAELRRRTGVRVLVVIGVTLAVLMIVFGQATAKSYDEFEAYKLATLDNPANPPAWETEPLSVEQCVDEVLAWVESCPGVSSWCESTLPDVTNKCLESQDRSELLRAGRRRGDVDPVRVRGVLGSLRPNRGPLHPALRQEALLAHLSRDRRPLPADLTLVAQLCESGCEPHEPSDKMSAAGRQRDRSAGTGRHHPPQTAKITAEMDRLGSC